MIVPPEVTGMANRVHLDAMIPREDFAIEAEEFAIDLLKDFPMANLSSESPILKLLRKPNFQRETNHWTPEQVVTFVASFLDNEIIPSLIFWKSPHYIFVIDGGHRLSALRAWMEDDYGDKTISAGFFSTDLSEEQKRVAKRTRKAIEKKIGRYSDLKKLVDVKGTEISHRRAKVLVTRGLSLQWIPSADPSVAETSFYKINSQGTPLDETERLLIENRERPIAIASRAILRSGTGHKYWSSFPKGASDKIVEMARKLHDLLFQPEAHTPLKSLDVPVGGPVSPLDALGVLIEFLTIAANRLPDDKRKTIHEYEKDVDGSTTLEVLANSLEVLERIIGKSKGSLGLHRGIYFYNERGKYSKFLFLGMVDLIVEKIRNNDGLFFKKFTKARSTVEDFLIDNKSLIGLALQNMAKTQRVPNIRKLLDYLVYESKGGNMPTAEAAISHLGMQGRILDVRIIQTSPTVTDDTKDTLIVRDELAKASRCPICQGRLDPSKSVSFDHKTKKAKGGTGDVDNIQMTHPYCNNSKDSLL
jgi:hypothetical protein